MSKNWDGLARCLMHIHREITVFAGSIPGRVWLVALTRSLRGNDASVMLG